MLHQFLEVNSLEKPKNSLVSEVFLVESVHHRLNRIISGQAPGLCPRFNFVVNRIVRFSFTHDRQPSDVLGVFLLEFREDSVRALAEVLLAPHFPGTEDVRFASQIDIVKTLKA